MLPYLSLTNRLKPFLSTYYRVVINNPECIRFRATYTPASLSSSKHNDKRYKDNPTNDTTGKRLTFAQRKRIRNRQDAINSAEKLKNFLDDELYDDPDFDYIDHRQIHMQQKNVEMFGHDPSTSARGVFSALPGPSRNALYDDEDDEPMLAGYKREHLSTQSGEKFVNRIHQDFHKEIRDKHVGQRLAESREAKGEIKARLRAALEEDHEKTLQNIRENPLQIIPRQIFDTLDKETRDIVKMARKQARPLFPLPYDINPENRFEVLNEIIMPLHRKQYSNQLKIKYQHCMDLMKNFGTQLRRMDGPVRINPKGLPCNVEDVRPSPLTERYRNKDEYSVWPGIDGNRKTVGFYIGQPSKHDRVICVEPEKIFISKQSHIELARKFQDYLRDVSPYDTCTDYSEGGNWRRVHIRSNRADQHMLTVVFHPQDLSPEQLQEEMDRFKQYFADDPRIWSLYFHISRNTRSNKDPFYHLAGEKTITEYLFDKEFIISPGSFFQVNTTGAEVLYRAIMTEVNAEKKNDITLLDLCCGTGALSCLMADRVKNVVGIDASEQAIEDAKRNAENNAIKNVTFHQGDLTQLLPQLAETSYFSGKVVAVLNPSRAGVHPNVIRTLRRMNFIEKLIYVSCKPEGDALANFIHLCRPRGDTSSPFVPINAVPVDLFPHTEHIELVLTFERF